MRLYGIRNLYWGYKNIGFRLKEFRDYAALGLPADYLIITKDGTNADLLAKAFGVKEEKIRHWRNGVDFDSYNPEPILKNRVCQRLGIRGDYKIIISTSRLIPFYNLDRLIYKLPELFKINDKCVCIIASDGPEREKFQEFVQQNNIKDKTFFVGMVEKTYLKDLLNTSDLFINLSSYSNCNNALFEAMVTGKCIVALENNIIKELIASGESGYLIKENELEHLPEILNRILQDEELLKRLGINARKAAFQKLWSWEKRMDEEFRLLESLV
jgi:glycosyltransferase involved in cell wall biosynthesis